MSQVELLGKLLPSLPELEEMLRKIREKYDIPEVLLEDEQLVEILKSSDFYDWPAIRQEIENRLRAWSQPALYRIRCT